MLHQSILNQDLYLTNIDKEFIKTELDASVKAGIMSGPLKQLCK